MFYSILKALILPPGCFFLLFCVGWLLLKWRSKLGRVFLWSALIASYLSSTPFVAGELMAPLQPYSAVDIARPASDVEAIVVLGAGTYYSAPEYWSPGAPPYGVDVADGLGLQRLQYAAYLAKATGRPILLTGGSGGGHGHRPVAEAMKVTLEREFGTTAAWLEVRATNTMENAKFSAQLLQQAGIHKVYLVTHAWHMPRAVLAFARTGLQVVPAPTAFVSRSEGLWSDFLPSASAMLLSYYAIHEWLGIAWYRYASE